MSLIIANILGFVAAHKRWFVIGGLVAVLIVSIVIIRRCGSRPSKLNEVEIQRGEQAVKEQNDKELREILINSEAREKIADETAANGTANKEAIVEESKKVWANANRDELQAEFDRRRGN